ncbi:MAG: hypothetical protein ABI164_11745 [Acidobacteriaceae bacterium]
MRILTANLFAAVQQSTGVLDTASKAPQHAIPPVGGVCAAESGSVSHAHAGRFRTLLPLLLLTVFAILIQGYHPGAEDDGIYLPAILQDLNPHLFPHNSGFFRTQTQGTIFDHVIAGSIRMTHLPVAWATLIWQFLAILLVLWGCLRIARFCFREVHAQWAGVSLVAVLLALPVTYTGLFLVDENLHPRTLATAAILAAIAAVLERRWWLAALLLAVACAFHPIMGPLGISYCVFLGYSQRRKNAEGRRTIAAMLPLAAFFHPASPVAKQALSIHDVHFLSHWTWYEWLGVVGPTILLWWFSRMARRSGSDSLERVSRSAVYFGFFQLAVALCIMLPQSLMQLRPLQPMRYLHIFYLLLVLLGGGLIGQRLLRRKVYRWAILFVPLCAGMFYAQCHLYAGTEHLELPGQSSKNPWLQAFTWIRTNTPVDAYFALDPLYLRLPGEDFHGFRALAQRSSMADVIKDSSVVTIMPQLGPEWQKQTAAEAGWQHFRKNDFDRLHREFGVNWVVVAAPAAEGLTCPYRNSAVFVCRLGP